MLNKLGAISSNQSVRQPTAALPAAPVQLNARGALLCNVQNIVPSLKENPSGPEKGKSCCDNIAFSSSSSVSGLPLRASRPQKAHTHNYLVRLRICVATTAVAVAPAPAPVAAAAAAV